MSSRRRALALSLALLPALVAGTAARADVVAGAGGDSYVVYQAPAVNPGDASNDAYNKSVEPSIGANWKTGKALFQADLTTYDVAFDPAAHAATWTPHKPITTSLITLDPILYTDSLAGRTVISQLAGTSTVAAYTDDDGATSTPVTPPASGVDHQTVGGGPFAAGLSGTAMFPRAVYYCAQDIAAAFCALSRDGGATFGNSNAIYTSGAAIINGCVGLHGHIRVRPDGTAMVPNQGCGPETLVSNPIKQGITVNATNNVGPWALDLVPDSLPTSNSDPSVAADAANTTYFGYENGKDAGGNAAGRVAVKKLSGDWAASVDVGAPLGVKSIAFPEVIAGSAGRAAMAFLGTTTAGDYQAKAFAGAWQLYIARTEDSGATWRTSQVTTDADFPVQRGCIQLGGPCTHRNLYDFNDITVDALGRVLVGFADGCTPTKGCTTGATTAGAADRTDVGTIARQECGTSLFAAQDAALAAACTAAGAETAPALPEAPVVPLLLLAGGAAIAVVALRRRRTA